MRFKFIIILFFGYLLEGSAQQNTKLNSHFILSDSIVGIANYNYIISKKDTVFQGDFLFQSGINKEDNTIKGISYEGFYNKGIKNGIWTFRNKNFFPENKTIIKGLDLVQQVSGNEVNLRAEFSNGKPNGQWMVNEFLVAKSMVVDTLFKTTVNFVNGKMRNEILSYNKRLQISGTINKDNLLEGSWVFEHKLQNGTHIKEVRVYENGIFKSHYFLKDKEKIKVIHVGFDSTNDPESEVWETLTVSEKYFNITAKTNFGLERLDVIHPDSLNQYVLRSNDLFLASMTQFKSIEGRNIWQALPGSETLILPQIKVRKHPFSTEEKQNLNAIQSSVNKMNDIFSKFFNDPTLDVNRFSNATLNLQYEVFKIYKDKVEKTEKLMKLLKNPAYEYINREEIYPRIVPAFVYPSAVDYEFKGEIISDQVNFPPAFKPLNYDLSALHSHIKTIEEDMIKRSKNVFLILDNYKKQFALNDQESLLLFKRDSILKIFDYANTSEKFNDYHKKFSFEVKSQVSSIFKNYASLDIEQKRDTIETVDACFDHFLSLYNTLEVLPKRSERLEELYTRTTWNPYTFTNMDEIVKARLYQACMDVLFPYLLEELGDSLTCDLIKVKLDNIDKLYFGMIDYREQDTRTIERQLRRVKNPREIIEILNLELN